LANNARGEWDPPAVVLCFSHQASVHDPGIRVMAANPQERSPVSRESINASVARG
jgi:hypothetical protein